MADSDPPAASTPPPPALPPGVPPDARDLYGHCFAGYQYRDQLIPQEFMFMTQGFFFLVSVMIAVRVVDDHLGGVVPRLIVLIVGAAGFVMTAAYLLDMHANASCKGRLRWMMLWMERGNLTPTTDRPPEVDPMRAGYWHFIDQRGRSWLERFARWVYCQFRRPRYDVAVTRYFLHAGLVYLVLWPIITLVLALR